MDDILPCGYPWGSGNTPPQINGEVWPGPCREPARTIGAAWRNWPWLRQRLHQASPGSNLAKEWGGMSTAQAVAICSPSRPGADIRQRMGGRVWMPGSEGVRKNGLAGAARPNHAQKALTKEVEQLLLQLHPSPSPRQ